MNSCSLNTGCPLNKVLTGLKEKSAKGEFGVTQRQKKKIHTFLRGMQKEIEINKMGVLGKFLNKPLNKVKAA